MDADVFMKLAEYEAEKMAFGMTAAAKRFGRSLKGGGSAAKPWSGIMGPQGAGGAAGGASTMLGNVGATARGTDFLRRGVNRARGAIILPSQMPRQ